jgi:hypothetical protein
LAEKYFDCWINLELEIAGPLFAARDKGDVHFILRRQAISGVEDFDDLMAWVKEQIARFRDHVCETEAPTPDEARSRDLLLSRATDLETLINLWPDFDREFGRGAA